MSTSDEAKTRAFDFLQKYLNTTKRDGKSTNDKDRTKKDKSMNDSAKKDDDWLTKKAISELQKEICINKVKRKAFGSVTVPKARANKRFLATTLSQCLSHNSRQTIKHETKSIDKLKELDRYRKLRNSETKFGERKHEYRRPEKKKKRKKSRRRSRSSSSSSDSD